MITKDLRETIRLIESSDYFWLGFTLSAYLLGLVGSLEAAFQLFPDGLGLFHGSQSSYLIIEDENFFLGVALGRGLYFRFGSGLGGRSFGLGRLARPGCSGVLFEFVEEFQFLGLQHFLILLGQQGKLLREDLAHHALGHLLGLMSTADHDAQNEGPGHADDDQNRQKQKTGKA